MTTESLFSSMKLLLAFAGVVLCALIIWAILSPVFFGMRWALEQAGLKKFFRYHRLLRLSRTLLRWPALAYGFVQARAKYLEQGVSVRVVMDERLSHLREMMLRTRSAVELACQRIAHFGTGGSAALAADILDLQRRTEEVSLLGGEIPDDLIKKYQTRAVSSTNLVIGTLFLILFAIGNGTFINQFMQNLIPTYFRGVPVSLVFSILLVIFEAGAGWMIAIGSAHEERRTNVLLMTIGIFAVIGFCTVEATIIGIMSYNFELDLPLLDTYPALRFWLAPLGAVFAALTAGVSYAVHKFTDERASANGALRIRREMKEANAYVNALPARFEKIRDRAREAQAALDSHAVALGARDGATPDQGVIGGLVTRVTEERLELVRAFGAVCIEDWSQIINGSPADDRREVIKNVCLFILSAVAVTTGIYVYSGFFAISLHGIIILPSLGWIAAAVIFVMSLYIIGFLPFQRLQNAERAGRVFPYRNSIAEKAGAAAIAALAAIALLWGGYMGFGVFGFLIGIVLIVGGATLSWLGYHFERSCRGLVVLAALVASVVAVLAAISLALFVLGSYWSLAVIFWGVWIFLYFLGLPASLVFSWRKLLQRHGSDYVPADPSIRTQSASL
jgi:hypothetical protein